MIWAPARNREQGLLVAGLRQRAAGVPCGRQAVIAGGLPGADKDSALAQAGIAPACYLSLSVDGVLREMAGRGMIPVVAGLAPLEAADLAHAEAQFLVKRAALRAIADGCNLLLDITFASSGVQSWLDLLAAVGYTTHGIFVEVSVEDAVRRVTAQHRRGLEEYRQGRGYGGRLIPPEAIWALAHHPRPSPIPPASMPAAAAATGPGLGAGGELAAMIACYRRGQLTLDDLAARFRARRWPPVPPACPPGLQAAAAAIDDPEPYVPGSFDDVVLGYDLGHLTDPDYAVLAAAAAGAGRKRPR